MAADDAQEATSRSPAYQQHIPTYINRSLDEEEEFHFLRFEGLQRANIANLQLHLIELKKKVKTNNSIDYDDLKTSLRDYALAVRDYQYLKDKRTVPSGEKTKRRLLVQAHFGDHINVHPPNPFYSHYSFFEDSIEKIDPLRTFLMRRLPSQLTYSPEERRERQREYSQGDPPKQVSLTVDRLVRFITAITGGAFLVVPMIVMILDQSQTKSLITASISVLLFALMVSFVVKVSNVETLVSTATYAAVLVVFVGTSTAPSSAT